MGGRLCLMLVLCKVSTVISLRGCLLLTVTVVNAGLGWMLQTGLCGGVRVGAGEGSV